MIFTESRAPLSHIPQGKTWLVMVCTVQSGAINIQQLDADGSWQTIETIVEDKSFRIFADRGFTGIEITGEANVRVY